MSSYFCLLNVIYEDARCFRLPYRNIGIVAKIIALRETMWRVFVKIAIETTIIDFEEDNVF